MITFEQFKEIELVCARILSVQDHPDADRLYVATIDVGEAEPRTVVAGIKEAYQPDELIGRLIVVIKNLEPAIIRAVESCGMLLATRTETGLSLIVPDKEAAPGARIS